MCLIVFAWQVHAKAPLLLAANRDEFHARPTRAAQFWKSHPQLLAGQDLEAGGTWLGITRQGRFAALTNVRNTQTSAPQATKKSRGELTRQFLIGDSSAQSYMEALAPRVQDYPGFNLLVGDTDTLYFLHVGSEEAPLPRALPPGVYGLSNASLDSPWPKVESARHRLAKEITVCPEEAPSPDALQHCISGRSLVETSTAESAGLERKIARQLSAQFIVTPDYGTRCCTTLRGFDDGSTEFRELRFDARGAETGRSEHTLTFAPGS